MLRAVEDVQTAHRDHPPFDHTTLIASVRSRWRLSETITANLPLHQWNKTPPLTRRDKAAPTFWHVVPKDAQEPDEAAGKARAKEIVTVLRTRLDELDRYYKQSAPKTAKFALTDLAKEILMDAIGLSAVPAAEAHISSEPARDIHLAVTHLPSLVSPRTAAAAAATAPVRPSSVNLTVVKAIDQPGDIHAPTCIDGKDAEWAEFAEKLGAMCESGATVRPIKLSQAAAVTTATTTCRVEAPVSNVRMLPWCR